MPRTSSPLEQEPNSAILGLTTAGAVILASAAAALALSILAASLDRVPLLAAPGAFFFEAYGYLAFLVPAYLLIAALILADRAYRPDRIFALSCTVVPFLTLAAGVALLRDPADTFDRYPLLESMGPRGIASIIAAATALECLGIVSLTAAIRERMLEAGRKRGRLGRLHPSVNPFVPKPGTPFQWLPMEDPKQTDRKLQYLRRAFGRLPNVDAICKSARSGAAQSVLALGDRRVADALEIAVTRGLELKGALREAGLDAGFYLFRRRERGERLPWDIVDNGVSKDYFWKELERSERERLSPHCPEVQGCIRCGVCSEQPNPGYRLPEQWKGRTTLPLYERLRDSPDPHSGRLRQSRS